MLVVVLVRTKDIAMRRNSPEIKTSQINPWEGHQAEGAPVIAAKLNIQLINVQAVADLLGIHPRTVWRMVAAGELPEPIRLEAKTARWRLIDLQEYVESLI